MDGSQGMYKQRVRRLGTYTFLTSQSASQEPNVYAGAKEENLTTFSNNTIWPSLLPQSAHRRGV
jgi:hypothetical protein